MKYSQCESITSKSEMYELYLSGAFGNKLRTWRTLDDLFGSDYEGNVTLRYRGLEGGRWSAYDVPFDDILSTVHKWQLQGADVERVTINEAAPDRDLLLQGEIQNSIQHYDLRYSFAKTSMRAALQDHQMHASGLRALMLVKHFASPSSWSDMEELLNKYCESVVEFSIWSRFVGDCSFRNMVVWEVRNY